MGIIPIYLIESKEDLEKAKDNYCYLVGSNGTFVKKENHVFSVIQHIHSGKGTISGLQEIEAKAFIRLPQIPEDIVKTILDFFSWCYNKYKAEGMVYLYYNSATKKYIVIPPKQEVSSGSVSYEIVPKAPEGFITVGTIHSHGSMGAFHSGTDDKDQTELDGIHITVSKAYSPFPEFDARLYVGGVPYKVDENRLMASLPKPKLSFPQEWENVVAEKKITPAIYNYPASKDYKFYQNQ